MRRTLNLKRSDVEGLWVMASQQQQPQNVTQLPQSQSRQAEEEARKDRTLAEFLLMLDDYEPLVCLFHMPVSYVLMEPQIPNEVTDYFLQRVGFECDDARLCVLSRRKCAEICTNSNSKKTPFISRRAEICLRYSSRCISTCSHTHKCFGRQSKGTYGRSGFG